MIACTQKAAKTYLYFSQIYSMIFEQNIPKLVIGDIDLGAMPAIALQALEQGFDSPSLRILAGLQENENEFTLRRYLKDALRELSIEIPDKRQATLQVAIGIANDIITARQPVVEGVNEMFLRIDKYPFHEESREYRYDSIGLQEVYIIFINAESSRDTGSPDENLEQELLTELKIWSRQFKDR
jgi:hypothetical protein